MVHVNTSVKRNHLRMEKTTVTVTQLLAVFLPQNALSKWVVVFLGQSCVIPLAATDALSRSTCDAFDTCQ